MSTENTEKRSTQLTARQLEIMLFHAGRLLQQIVDEFPKKDNRTYGIDQAYNFIEKFTQYLIRLEEKEPVK